MTLACGRSGLGMVSFAAIVAAVWLVVSIEPQSSAPQPASEGQRPSAIPVAAVPRPVTAEPVWRPLAAPLAAPLQAPREVPAVARVFPYRFLGRLGEGSSSAVLLFGNGRVLIQQGVGPLDDEYAVDAEENSYLVVRHVATGAVNMLKLDLHDGGEHQQLMGYSSQD